MWWLALLMRWSIPLRQQPKSPEACVPVLADDDVIVDGDAERGGDGGTGAREFMNGYGPWPNAA
jgi:hypothetical protein